MTTKRKKRTPKQNAARKITVYYSIEDKMAAMRVIEEHDMCVNKAAEAMGLHRTTLFKWKAELWEDYLEQKASVQDKMLTVQAKKLLLFAESDKLIEKSTGLFEKAIDFFSEAGNFENLPAKEKVNLVNVILPYVLQKRVVLGVKENTPVQQNNFFQNVYNDMKNSANGNNQNTNTGNPTEYTVSE